MSSTVQLLQAQARAAPAWLRRTIIALPFFLPLVWIVGDDTPFDWVLAIVTDLAGKDADLRHLTAYLLCVLVLLIPGGLLLQVVGRARLKRSAERA
ncbi:MAG: hypothetical protein ACRBN8_44205 [Nannocystales bacterium]